MNLNVNRHLQERIQDFKLGGAHKKIAPSGGRRENCWGISCEKSRFYAKKCYFFPIAEGGAKIFGVFRVKNHHFTQKKIIFFPILGGARAGSPPPGSALDFMCKEHLTPCIYSLFDFYKSSEKNS